MPLNLPRTISEYPVYSIARHERQTTAIRTFQAERRKRMHPRNTLKSKFNAASSLKASRRQRAYFFSANSTAFINTVLVGKEMSLGPISRQLRQREGFLIAVQSWSFALARANSARARFNFAAGIFEERVSITGFRYPKIHSARRAFLQISLYEHQQDYRFDEGRTFTS